MVFMGVLRLFFRGLLGLCAGFVVVLTVSVACFLCFAVYGVFAFKNRRYSESRLCENSLRFYKIAGFKAYDWFFNGILYKVDAIF